MAKDTFEKDLKKLEEIVAKLEGGDVQLDASMKLFEEGVKLSRLCSERLEKAGKRVEILTKNKTGEIIKLYRNTGKIVIKGINFKFKHVKPTKEGDVGEIKQFEAPIHHSNVKLNLKES